MHESLPPVPFAPSFFLIRIPCTTVLKSLFSVVDDGARRGLRWPLSSRTKLPAVLFAIAGSARTFVTVYPKTYQNFVTPFGGIEHPDMFFYLKTATIGDARMMQNQRNTPSDEAARSCVFTSSSTSARALLERIRSKPFTHATIVHSADEVDTQTLRSLMKRP